MTRPSIFTKPSSVPKSVSFCIPIFKHHMDFFNNFIPHWMRHGYKNRRKLKLVRETMAEEAILVPYLGKASLEFSIMVKAFMRGLAR
jgi:hypothetical protein